jgi:hypothetical protein
VGHAAATTTEKSENGNNKEEHKPLETAKDVAEIDRRVGELERLIGSAGTSLDDVRPSALFFLRFLLERVDDPITELSHANATFTASHSAQHTTHGSRAAPTPR